ncbi:transcriptional regulator protein YdcR [Escherichia coli]|uniref:Transcriptional regulator protein YdcR n=1 Tax=Escherichia coli TaxID=562 RepID=A0A376KVD4_ECOLX|nr:transcriptional regulator protein YdcR [Escherichia coli]
MIENLPPGNAELRQAIARRYALQGITISPDEIVITAGALEALNLSLQAVTEPGDWGDSRESLFLWRVAGAGTATAESVIGGDGC